MDRSDQQKILVLLLSVLAGLAAASLRRSVQPQPRSNVALRGASLQLRELNIYGNTQGNRIQMAVGEGPGLWIYGPQGVLFSTGVHGNGTPFLLVSDGATRNFGLTRIDGRNQSPILVFRENDIVRMVFGLNMQQPIQEPFLVHYSKNQKNLLFGTYCDDPGRVCTY